MVTWRQGRLATGRHMCPPTRCVPVVSVSICRLSACVSPHACLWLFCVHTLVCRFCHLCGCTRVCAGVCAEEDMLLPARLSPALRRYRECVCCRVCVCAHKCRGRSLRPCRAEVEKPLEKMLSSFMSHLHISCTILKPAACEPASGP